MESTATPKVDRRRTARSTDTLAITVSMIRRIPATEIARRAFELYCARGGQHGQALDDWLRAERELIASPPPMAAVAIAPALASNMAPRPQPRKRAPRTPTKLD